MLDDWEQARAFLVRTFKVALERPGCLGLVWRHGPDLTALGQRIEHVRAFGGSHIAISCDVVHANAMSPVEALALNQRLTIGALGLARGGYVLRDVLALEALAPAVLVRAIESVARETTRLRAASMPKSLESPFAYE